MSDEIPHEDEEVDVVTVTGRFDGVNNLISNVPGLVRAARREAKGAGMKVEGRVLVTVMAEVREREPAPVTELHPSDEEE